MKHALSPSLLKVATQWGVDLFGDDGFIDNRFSLPYNDSLMHIFTLDMPWTIEGDPTEPISRGIAALAYKRFNTEDVDGWGVLFYQDNGQFYVRSAHITPKNNHEVFVNLYPNAQEPTAYQEALFALEQLL